MCVDIDPCTFSGLTIVYMYVLVEKNTSQSKFLKHNLHVWKNIKINHLIEYGLPKSTVKNLLHIFHYFLVVKEFQPISYLSNIGIYLY